MKKLLVTIDPGQSGAFAWYIDDQSYSKAMPDTEKDIADHFVYLKDLATQNNAIMEVFLEKVHSMPGQGVASSFKFGEHFGFLKGVITTLEIRLELVTPQAWMKTMSLGTSSSCASKTEWKNKLKGEAQRLYPQQKVTLKTADALLILEYAVRREKNKHVD